MKRGVRRWALGVRHAPEARGHSRRRGVTIIELMIAGIILTILLAGLFYIFVAINGIQTTAGTMPQVQDNAQQVAITVGDAIRKAELCTSSDSGCTLNAGVESTGTNSVTVYDHNGTGGALRKIVYSVDGSGNFTKKIDSGTASTLFTGVTLSITYYKSSTYHASSLTSYTPDSTTTPSLIAVQVTATVTSGSMSASYTTTVRLRNGPLKSNPTD